MVPCSFPPKIVSTRWPIIKSDLVCVVTVSLVSMLRRSVFTVFINGIIKGLVSVGGHGGHGGVLKNRAFYGSKCDLLVIHLNANGQLGDSTPCCMCVNLMKEFHISRVYYSNAQGDLCCQKIAQWNEEDFHVSHGLRLMIDRHGHEIRTCHLPLTKAQKTQLFHGGLRSP